VSGKECFGVILRTAGLTLILLASYDVSASDFVALTPERHHSMGPRAAIVYGLLFAAAGLFLLRGASWLVKFSYPLQRESSLKPVGLDSEPEHLQSDKALHRAPEVGFPFFNRRCTRAVVATDLVCYDASSLRCNPV